MAQPVTIPKIGESVATVFINKWLKKPGDHVEAGENLLEIDSDKASMEVPSPASGTVIELLAAEGDEVEVGAVVAQLDENGVASAASAPGAPTSTPAAVEPSAGVKAGPAARAEASEQGVDLAGVKGSGKGGRVMRADVSKAVAEGGQKAEPPPAARAPVADDAERITRVKMSPLRRTVARRLVQAQQEAAMLTTFNEVDMSAVMAVRKRYQDRFVERYGIKLGFMSFFVKGVIEGLKAFPAVNAEIDGTDVLYKRYYNLGVAVSGPKGLVVPVLRDVDKLSFAQTELGIAELAKRARDNALRVEDFDDGTFTISNGGVFGSMLSTPILNPPQVGILGMHNIVERPVVRAGQVVVAPVMYVALSYDHRIIDGREAVSFLVRVKECVEDPERLLLEV